MSERLGNISRALNIGMQTIANFLESNGHYVELNPNVKITDEQYDMLIQHFGMGTRLSAFPWKEDHFNSDANLNRKTVNSHGWNKLRDDIVLIMPTRLILVPKDQSVDQFSYWTVSDFKEKCHSAMDGGKIIKELLSIPSGYIPVTPNIAEPEQEQKNNLSSEKKIEIFTPRHQTSGKGLSVVEKINLNSLNASIRPAHISRDERKRGRDTLDRQLFNSIENDSRTGSAGTNSYQNAVRDIWQKFIDVQEKLIRQRCSPISIVPDSVEIDNDKLYVTVDESQNEQKIEYLFKDKLGLEAYDIESGFILVDETRWNKISESELEQIRKGLSECYVELDTTPTINVTVSYSGDIARSDQLSIEELQQMDSILKNGTLIEGSIDDTVAFISKVSVQREKYLKYLFGDHYVTYEKKKKNQKDSKVVEQLEYHNQYIPWDQMLQYAHIGLICKCYTLIFKVNNSKAAEVLKASYDCYFPNSDTFEFCRSFTKKDPCHKDYVQEAKDNIHAFMNEATIYCSKDDIDIDVLFVYSFSNHQIVKAQLQEAGRIIKGKGNGYSFNEDTGSIGVDFNWRTDNINEILSNIENELPFIKVNVHDDHRYKCKVHSQLVGYDELKSKLEDKYEDIYIENDNIYHQITIRLPYIESEYYEIKRANLENDLFQLTVTGVNVQFAEKVEGKVRLNVSYNKESRLEDLEDSILEMRKADFGFMLNETEIPFGKLLKANYPDLVFDIDVEEDKKERIIEAFESKAITTIIPILAGDLEKISRLKNTFTMATTGAELVNPRLQRFIFNSAEATITQDIDLILRKDGVVYRELCEHLLNETINESQKVAIIKAMYANDLAVIQGPPGTGKSTAIAEMIWQLIRKGLQPENKRERILLTSETNLAVDNAISRIVNSKTNLVKPIRLGGEEKLETEGLQFSIELMKRWVEEGDPCLLETESDEETDSSNQNSLILKNWLSNISARSFYRSSSNDNDIVSRWRNYLEHPNEDLRNIVYNRYVENANVIGATCSSIGDRRAGNAEFNGFTPFYHNYCEVFKQRKGKAKIEFTTVIQDESSKATPAELVLPFVYGHRAIVIGDHRQLPPMLDKEEFEETLDYAYKIATEDKDREDVCKLKEFVDSHFGEMEVSHFQRLYENIDSSLKGTFNLQYRMHPDINEVVEQFYRNDGGLSCGLTNPIDLGVNDPEMNNPASRYHGLDIPGLIDHNTHVLFIDTNSPEMMDGTSRVNYGEVDTIDKILAKFESSDSFHSYLNKFSKDEDKQIGIISFYGKQIKQLRAIAHAHSTIPVRVSTVDRFQGMERNIVIVSMVRSNTIQSSRNQQPDWKRYPEFGYPKQCSLGFAQSPNRLNVALSRAKRLLVIVGNRELFSTHEIYQRLFDTIVANKNNKVFKQQDI
ncbi:MAG: AAA domain-containing protein [Bacteroidaceae bacterium]|nr:AAA domain-containing protein [Bacteroidaceae bacterium]